MWCESITTCLASMKYWIWDWDLWCYFLSSAFLYISSFPIYLLASQRWNFLNIAMSYAWSEMLIKLWPRLTWACQAMCQILRLLIRWCCNQTFLQLWANPYNGRDADFAVLLFLFFSPFSSPCLPCSLSPFSFPYFFYFCFILLEVDLILK